MISSVCMYLSLMPFNCSIPYSPCSLSVYAICWSIFAASVPWDSIHWINSGEKIAFPLSSTASRTVCRFVWYVSRPFVQESITSFILSVVISSPPSNISERLILFCKLSLIESTVESYVSKIWRMASLAVSAASWDSSIVLLKPSRAKPAPAAATPVAFTASAFSSWASVFSSVDSVSAFLTVVRCSALSAYSSFVFSISFRVCFCVSIVPFNSSS